MDALYVVTIGRWGGMNRFADDLWKRFGDLCKIVGNAIVTISVGPASLVGPGMLIPGTSLVGGALTKRRADRNPDAGNHGTIWSVSPPASGIGASIGLTDGDHRTITKVNNGLPERKRATDDYELTDEEIATLIRRAITDAWARPMSGKRATITLPTGEVRRYVCPSSAKQVKSKYDRLH